MERTAQAILKNRVPHPRNNIFGNLFKGPKHTPVSSSALHFLTMCNNQKINNTVFMSLNGITKLTALTEGENNIEKSICLLENTRNITCATIVMEYTLPNHICVLVFRTAQEHNGLVNMDLEITGKLHIPISSSLLPDPFMKVAKKAINDDFLESTRTEFEDFFKQTNTALEDHFHTTNSLKASTGKTRIIVPPLNGIQQMLRSKNQAGTYNQRYIYPQTYYHYRNLKNYYTQWGFYDHYIHFLIPIYADNMQNCIYQDVHGRLIDANATNEALKIFRAYDSQNFDPKGFIKTRLTTSLAN